MNEVYFYSLKVRRRQDKNMQKFYTILYSMDDRVWLPEIIE